MSKLHFIALPSSFVVKPSQIRKKKIQDRAGLTNLIGNVELRTAMSPATQATWYLLVWAIYLLFRAVYVSLYL